MTLKHIPKLQFDDEQKVRSNETNKTPHFAQIFVMFNCTGVPGNAQASGSRTGDPSDFLVCQMILLYPPVI